MTDHLTVIAASEAHGESSGGLGAVGLDPLAILAQAATFLLLFVIVKRFALEKIVKTLEDRRKAIDSGVRLGIEMQAEQAKLEETIQRRLHEVRLQADTILADAHQEAGAIIKQAETAASQLAETFLKDAHARITGDIRKAKEGLEQEAVNLVAEAAEILVGEKLDAKKDSSLIRRALEGVSRK